MTGRRVALVLLVAVVGSAYAALRWFLNLLDLLDRVEAERGSW